MTQCECLLELTKRGWASPLDLFYECGSLRFSGRIYDLKQEGYEFEERTCSRVGKLGKRVAWKEFRLKRTEKQAELF